MALIKTGAIVTQISGKVGGQTFGKGQSGAYIKNTGSYINKRSGIRDERKAVLTSVTGLWRQLSDAQKNSWIALAPSFPYTNRVGDVSYYSGFNLFTKFNYNLQLDGQSPIPTAPTVSTVTPPTLVSVAVGSGTAKVTTDVSSTAGSAKIYCSKPLSPGNTQYRRSLRMLTIAPFNTINAGIDIVSLIEGIFGDYPDGARYYVELLPFDTNTGQPIGTPVNTNWIADN